MNRGNEDIVHFSPTPGRAPVFFGIGLVLFVVAYVPAVFFDALGGPLTAFWPVVGLGVLPALFCWHAFGSRIYESIPAVDLSAETKVPLAPSSARFTFVAHEGHPHGAIIECPSESGTPLGDAHLLCCDPSEPRRFPHPFMSLQYAAWTALAWHAVKPLRDPFYLLAGAFVAILICFFWLIVDSPWFAIDFTREGCFLDINAAPRGREGYRLRIVRAIPDGSGILLKLDDAATRRVAFPGGSLSPEAQQTIALDLFRHHGIPTTEEDNPAAGVYR